MLVISRTTIRTGSTTLHVRNGNGGSLRTSYWQPCTRESRFDADARTPRRYVFFGLVPWGRQSSAYGYAQVLDGTWDWYRSETGTWFARRDNFGHAVDFMGWYMNKTTQKAGVSKSDAYNQYLAYHQGHQGYLEGRYRNIGWLKDVAQIGRCAIKALRAATAPVYVNGDRGPRPVVRDALTGITWSRHRHETRRDEHERSGVQRLDGFRYSPPAYAIPDERPARPADPVFPGEAG